MSLGSALSGLNRLNNFGAGRRSSTPPVPVPGYVYLLDSDGAYLLDSDGYYLLEAV